jgi:hypothetical protein
MPTLITSKMIKDLLADKHSTDVFVTECRTGAAWDKLKILDAWVMSRSWAHPMITGYEIKVHRSDFLKDNKWMNYLPYCNQFYFVTTRALAVPEELPADVGLMYVSETGTKLYTKRKATYREIDPITLSNLYKYILMSRAVMQDSSFTEHISNTPSSKKYWETWLEKKTIDRAFGHHVSREIREAVNEEMEKIKKQNSLLKKENENLQKIRQVCERMSVDLHSWNPLQDFQDKIAGDSRALQQSLNTIEGQAKRLREKLEKQGKVALQATHDLVKVELL